MKKLMILALVLLTSPVAFADKVKMTPSLKSAMQLGGIRYIDIQPVAAGKLRVIVDPNRCSQSGQGLLCTKTPLQRVVVEPVTVSDQRPVDGPLVLRLTKSLLLEIGSGFNLSRTVTYTALVKRTNGGVARYPLQVHLQTEVFSNR